VISVVCFTSGEILALRRLAPHPNIVALIDSRSLDGFDYITTGACLGGRLSSLVAASLGEARVRDLLLGVADALRMAHAVGAPRHVHMHNKQALVCRSNK